MVEEGAGVAVMLCEKTTTKGFDLNSFCYGEEDVVPQVVVVVVVVVITDQRSDLM